MRRLFILMLAFLLLSAVASVAESQQVTTKQTFDAFWAQFKAAVAKNDKEAVAAMTRFPFPFANSEITRDEFIKKYNSIIEQKYKKCLIAAKPVNDYEAYLEAVRITRKANVAQPEEQQDRGGYHVICGADIYCFEIVEGKYKFTEIGVND